MTSAISPASSSSTLDARVTAFLARRADSAEDSSATSMSTGNTTTDAPPRRVMTRAEALALAQYVREATREPDLGIIVDHTATAVASQRVGRAPQSRDVDHLWLRVGCLMGSAVIMDIGTNVRDTTMLRHVLHKAMVTKTPPPLPDPDDDQPDAMEVPKPARYLPVTLWHPRTAAAAATERGTALTQLTAPFQGTDWHGMGTVAFGERAFFFLDPSGAETAFGESTDSEVSVSVRSSDGSAAGWSGHAHRDWSQIDPAKVARSAIAIAEQQRNPSRAEPGRYTAILSATAVGQLLQAIAPLFDVLRGPFEIIPRNPALNQGRTDRRGMRVMDPRVTLWSDPADPEGGDLPFFYGDGGMGHPNPANTWVEKGILKLRSVNVGDALMAGMIARKTPWATHMSGGLTSVDEMIKNCERGIYVHRFANLQIVDARSGALGGFTRDGCLLIEHGKISRPVKDFRIFESPFLSLNQRLVALGPTERIAFGFTPRNQDEENPHTWPLPPVIAPSIMVTDFNFVALSDAV